MRLHTGAKPFKCPHCEQRFRTSGHRKSHIASHFRPPELVSTRKRKTTRLGELDFVNIDSKMVNIDNAEHMVATSVEDAAGTNQVINLDSQVLQQVTNNQSMLQPVSLSIGDNFVSNIIAGDNSSGLNTQVLQGLEGIQLQLTGSNQGIQITSLDPSMLQQTVQIDASLLQQLQQAGNLNLTINPNILLQPGQQGGALDTNSLLQNIHIQQISNQPEPVVNPNIVIQPIAHLDSASHHVVTSHESVASSMDHMVSNPTASSLDVTSQFLAVDSQQAHHQNLLDSSVHQIVTPKEMLSDHEGDDMGDSSVVTEDALDLVAQDGQWTSQILVSGDPERQHVCPVSHNINLFCYSHLQRVC
jgi:hypothetical protein